MPKRHTVFFLIASLLLPCQTIAVEVCTDRSPAAVARTLGIDPNPLATYRDTNNKPNVIIILVDDMGYGDLSIYGNGLPTPNIDRIGQEGAKFTDGYSASPACSPSRAALMTGKWPYAIGHRFNMHDSLKYGLPLLEKTMADYFKEMGYVTGIIGKWHLGMQKGYTPDDRGFDEYFYNHHASGWDAIAFYPNGYTKMLRYNSKPSLWDMMKPCSDKDKHLTDIQGLEATSFILRHKDEPFFLYLSTSALHVPAQSQLRKESIAKRMSHYSIPAYAKNIFNSHKRSYFRATIHLDEMIGHVLDTLDMLGLSKNTLVWFLSDNGQISGQISEASSLRGIKGSLYEGGIRVPFMVRWKETIPPAVHKWPISSVDILPSLLAIASPEKDFSHLHLGGDNMLPYLKSETLLPPYRDLYWKMGSALAIRSGKWKLVSHLHQLNIPYQHELYDLQHDISEQKNLFAKNPQIFISLWEKLEAWNGDLD